MEKFTPVEVQKKAKMILSAFNDGNGVKCIAESQGFSKNTVEELIRLGMKLKDSES